MDVFKCICAYIYISDLIEYANIPYLIKMDHVSLFMHKRKLDYEKIDTGC